MVGYALAAAIRGWHVFPVAPDSKYPAFPAAHGPGEPARAQCRGACGRIGHGLHDATHDPDVITEWWHRIPGANVGIATGASHLVVLDLDMPKSGVRAPTSWDLPGVRDGADALAHLCERAGQPMPVDTFTVRTGRGGLHLYFVAPREEELGNTSGAAGRGLGWCIDTRAVGGYVLGAGSRVPHPEGPGAYVVINHAEPMSLPKWLVALLCARPQQPVARPTHLGNATGYGNAALRGEVQRVVEANEGSRNDTLNRAAFRLGRLVGAGALPEDAVVESLEAAALSAGLPVQEARATVASGLRAGIARPVRVTGGTP